MTPSSPYTDRELLRTDAYGTTDALAIRQRIHELYTDPKIDFPAWTLDRIVWRGDEHVLDIGAGTGLYVQALRHRLPDGVIYAGDLSSGMTGYLAQFPADGCPLYVLNADVQALPFPDHALDVILANHMLYHVPDLELALREIHRVLKPSGCLIAATNGDQNMAEFQQLLIQGCVLLNVERETLQQLYERWQAERSHFRLETSAPILARHFFAVQRNDQPSALILPQPEPVMEYLQSMRALRAPALPPDITWEMLMAVIEDWLRKRMGNNSLMINKLAGAFVATDSGVFATEYVTRLARPHMG